MFLVKIADNLKAKEREQEEKVTTNSASILTLTVVLMCTYSICSSLCR